MMRYKAKLAVGCLRVAVRALQIRMVCCQSILFLWAPAL